MSLTTLPATLQLSAAVVIYSRMALSPTAIREYITTASDWHHDWQWSSSLSSCAEGSLRGPTKWPRCASDKFRLGVLWSYIVEEFRRNTHSHFKRTYRSNQVNEPSPPGDILLAFWKLESLGIMDKPVQRMTAEGRVAVAQVWRHWRSGIGDTELESPVKKASQSSLTIIK